MQQLGQLYTRKVWRRFLAFLGQDPIITRKCFRVGPLEKWNPFLSLDQLSLPILRGNPQAYIALPQNRPKGLFPYRS